MKPGEYKVNLNDRNHIMPTRHNKQISRQESSELNKRQINWRSYPLVPWVVFVMSLFLTAAACYFSNQNVENKARERFAFRVIQVTDAVKGRMLEYEQVLRGGVGLFMVSPSVSRKQWRDYVSNADMATHYPGIQNMAVSLPVPAAQKQKHIESVRAEGFPDYTIRPELPERPIYHTLIYDEPFSGRNLRAFGFDMYTNPVRRAAMDRAIDQGLPTVSGMVTLAQETNQDVQHGFIYCMPVYRSGQTLANSEQRREALQVLVCGAFRLNDLMRGIFGASTNDMELEIFDNGVIRQDSRMYSSFGTASLPQTQYKNAVTIEVGGRPWSLQVSANKKFLDSVASVQTIVVTVAGILLNFALFVTLHSLSGRERKARELAEEMTHELMVSNEETVALGNKNAQLNQRLSLATDSAGIGVWDYWVPENRLIWDKRMYFLYGVQEENFSGAYDVWQGGLHPDDKERGDMEINQALRGEKEFDTEFRVVWPSGDVRHIKATAVVLRDGDGKPLRMIGMNYDISARKAAEEELAIKQRQLQTLNETLAERVAEEVRKNRKKDSLLLHQDKLAAIGQLAAGVAHEINNPMGFIMSNFVTLKNYMGAGQTYLSALEEALEGGCPEERRKALAELRKELDIPFILKDLPILLSESLDGAERVKRIVLDLKDFARLDEDSMRETDLNQCVKSTANIVRNEIKYIADLDLQLNEIPMVICNSQQINQVIANLLVNAGQAMDKHGAITVTSRQEGEQVVLSISDTGRGMTEEIRKRIFEPFFTTKDIGKGTGLGLSIAYDIIKKHGGEITLESEPGKGTTFTIKLPIKRT